MAIFPMLNSRGFLESSQSIWERCKEWQGSVVPLLNAFLYIDDNRSNFNILHRKLRTYFLVVKWGAQAKGESERAKV